MADKNNTKPTKRMIDQLDRILGRFADWQDTADIPHDLQESADTVKRQLSRLVLDLEARRTPSHLTRG